MKVWLLRAGSLCDVLAPTSQSQIQMPKLQPRAPDKPGEKSQAQSASVISPVRFKPVYCADLIKDADANGDKSSLLWKLFFLCLGFIDSCQMGSSVVSNFSLDSTCIVLKSCFDLF